jgi:hypothetical protein
LNQDPASFRLPIEVEKVARVVLYVWAWVAQAFLSISGYDQERIELWKRDVETLLPAPSPQ